MIRPIEFMVEVDRGPSGVTLRIVGDIDIATINQLEQARDGVLSDDPASVVIDLRRVGFLDSSGLKFLLQTTELAQAFGAELHIIRPPENVMKVFTLTGADQRLPLVDSDGR
jgi:anti-sigma B factor antagonist